MISHKGGDMLKPLKDRIIVERLAAEERTKSGIVLPDTAKEKPEQGKVIACGKDVKEIKVGNTIIFSKYGPTEIKLDGKEFLVIKEEEILAILG